MSVFLTGYWTQFGKDEFFRKFEVYNMEWPPEVKLDTLSITSAPNGGLIALMRNRSKVVKIQGGSKPVVSIYNAAGKFVSSFVWDSGHVVQMGWSSTCDLLCVREDGQVLIYDMFANWKHRFSMGQEAQDIKVVDAKIFQYGKNGTGVAVLTTANTIFLVNNVKDVKVRKLPEVPGVNNSPSAWVVVSESRSSRVLFAKDKDIFCLSESETLASIVNINVGDDSYVIKDLAVSSNYEMLAVLTSRGKLWLGSLDGRDCKRIFDLARIGPQHDQLLWCGVDSVVIRCDSTLDIVGLINEDITYTYDESVFCIQEIDCIRVISSTTMEIIEKVPQEVRDIFKINSCSPGAYLLEASKQFQKRSHRANEYLHLVKPKLFMAVMQCIEAAGHQFDVDTQKMLIKAAQFGKICLDDCSPEPYVTMIRILRCLNTIRNPNIGLPITFVQLQTLTLQGLMETLMIRRHHFLAYDVASFLRMPDCSRIQLHWACYKVQNSKEGVDVIAHEIKEKLGNAKDVSYRDIAMEAYECGKQELAIKLIEYEPRADLQIPLLLKLNEHFLALNKAIESGNTDLVYDVLDHMGKNIGEAKFQMAIRNYPLPQALYVKHCANHNRDLLKDVYTQEDDHKSLAEFSIKEYSDPRNSGMREALLVSALESYKRAKMEFNLQLCEEQLKLYRYQKVLEEKLKRSFYGLSLHDTVKLLLTMKEVKLADKLRAEYKVPDRRYWWIRIDSLGEQEDLFELEKFSKLKKSPIGYEPFVDVCLKVGNRKEAIKYLSRVRDELKPLYYTKLGMLEEAVQLAFEKKDADALEFLAPKCDPVLSDKIRQYIKTLGN